MSFGREKRLLLGWLALLAPLPIPFNDLLDGSLLLIYSALVAMFLRRAMDDPDRWLPNWAMNLLGLAYFPILVLDFTVFYRGQALRPILHLVLFSITVKLFAIRRDRDVWQVFLGVTFIALAAVGTSVHPSIVIYLIAFLALTLVILVRFAFFQVLAAFGHREHPAAETPIRGFVVIASVLIILVSVPLFALLPRVKSPFIMGEGIGTGTEIHASGFSDRMSLDVIGRIRGNREVALRARYEGDRPEEAELRFKGATYDLYKDHQWRRQSGDGLLRKGRDGLFALSGKRATEYVEIFLQPMRSTALPLPLEAIDLEIEASELRIDDGGAVFSRFPRPGGWRYVAGLGQGFSPPKREPRRQLEPTLDRSGLSQRMVDLAREVAGSGNARQRAGSIERHLLTGYEYTLDFVGRGGEEPLENFLFDTRAGHCEYFASAMVLMLRAEEIPARLVTGFLGGEYNPLEDYVIVRHGNAHAWVEAWIEDEGWVVFDPTPPSGRPVSEPPGIGRFFRQVADYMLFRWDRYVLTFGVEDQVRFFSRLQSIWRGWLALFEGGESSPMPKTEARAEEAGEVVILTDHSSKWPVWMSAIALSFLVLASWFWWRAWRRPWTGEKAYRELRQRLQKSGMSIQDSDPPLAVWKRATLRFPDAARQTDRILRLYLEESFAGRQLSEEQRQQLRRDGSDASKAIRKAS